VTLKQANDFKGSGNDMTLTAASTRSTTVSGSCTLAFTTQPADAGAGVVISGMDNTPIPPASPVGVALRDAAGQIVKGGTGQVTLTVAEPSGAPAPAENTASFSAATGIASFSKLNITTPGTYRLRAQTTAARHRLEVRPLVFRIDTISKVCERAGSARGRWEQSNLLHARRARRPCRRRGSPVPERGLDLDETLCGAGRLLLHGRHRAFNVRVRPPKRIG
jgi:hypothetical protein